MTSNNNGLWDDKDDHTEQNGDDQPRGYRVEDDDNLEEKDLRRSFLFGDSEEKKADEPGMEGKPVGGEKFGENNLTPSGDDKDNPSQNAGNNNGYFKRTEPSEEHPENTNFKSESQSGKPDYSQAHSHSENEKSGDPNQHKTEEKNPNTYQEGTADNDGETNIPGPNELPDQQKVGEDNDGNREDPAKYHVET